ncbi:MAG: hypothetical protein SGILL_006229, partial [Bacillariaceae sp.]
MIANSKAKSRYANMKFLLACLVVVLSHGICAFQLSMVASRAPFGGGRKFDSATTSRENSYTQNRRQPVSPHKPTSVTDSFISSLACAALKRRLKDQTHVSCDATMDPSSLFSGKVGPVTVKGRGWASSLGLTARALEATVDECQLDMARILTNQKLVLTTPGAEDAELVFLKENVQLDAATGSVVFYGTYAGATWEFALTRASSGDNKAVITAALVESHSENDNLDYAELADALTETTSNFFNEMVFELDGTFLSFRDMMLTDKGSEPSVMLSLAIT